MAGKVAGEAAHETFIENLRYAGKAAAAEGRVITIEPINPGDVAGYFLARQDQAHAIVTAVGEPDVRMQMDLYHAQVVEGDLAIKLKQYLPLVAHVQIAGVPGRYEPDIGEVRYPYLFDLLDDNGYDGWVGCEYVPRGRTEDGLGWLTQARKTKNPTAKK